MGINNTNNIKSKLLLFISQIPLLHKRYYCSCCGKSSLFFRPVGSDYESINKLDIIGAGYRKSVRCPVCGASDRARWVDYVISHYSDIYEGNKSVLHIAPERCIEYKIRNNSNCKYITGDISGVNVDEKIDVTNMRFKDETFDYIIINHVLEHIENEKAAFEEMKRCIRRDGTIIFSVPISATHRTYQKESTTCNEERIELYGQEDHYRLYGYDIVEYLQKYDMNIVDYAVDEIMSEDDILAFKFMRNDRVYFCEKR